MKPATTIAFALAWVAAPTTAQSPFDGTWKLDANSSHVSDAKFNISMQDGTFTCLWCTPVWSAPADAAFHAVQGQAGYDEASIEIVDQWTAVFTRRKDRRTFYRTIDTVSKDGRYLAFSWTETNGSGKVESGTGLWRRLTPLPAGAHAVTGQWRELWTKAISEDEVDFTIKTEGDILHMAIAPGVSMTAKFDGPATKIVGDARGTMASVRRVGDKAFVQTDFINGEPVSVTTSTLLDLTAMEIVIEHRRSGTKSRYTARKQ